MRARIGVVTGLVAVTAIGLVTGCSKNTGNDEKADAVHRHTAGIATDPADSKGPAPAVAGATTGGTLRILQEKDYEHLDPQRTYVSNAGIIEQLFTRTLTGFTQGAHPELVGDLATGPGTDVDGSCRTWRFTLKTGLKYEDGSTITAADVARGIARSFSPDLAEGPHYLQQWLADAQVYNAKYTGPFNGGAALPPGLTVSGSRNLTFHFAKPHCDLPFAAAMSGTVPVPAAKDTGTKYDLHPFSSGPYKIASYERDRALVLVRNPHWDPATDPIRHAYPDSYRVDLGASDVEQTNRVLADEGADQTTLATATVPQSLLPTVERNAAAMKRVTTGQNGFTFYLALNCERITDPTIRKAMEYAVDRGAVTQALGGPHAAEPATTLLSPTIVGWKNYDAFPAGDHGNVVKAKALLKGRHPKLVYAYQNSTAGQREAPLIKQMFERAGFQIVLRPVDATTFSTALGQHPQYDFYQTGWGADWPSGASTLPVLFDGRSIRAKGNNDTVYFNADDINARMDALAAMPAAKAAPQWSALEQRMVSTYAPIIPLYYSETFLLHGSKVGGLSISLASGSEVFTNAYVKS